MDVDDDLAFALFLQEQFNSENNGVVSQKPSNLPTSFVDPSWEYIDPNPDIRQLFLQFNDEYFDGLLGGVEVRWSPRMTLCAGLCCYEGRGGLCSIRLSAPLLKLRPRKDLVETLLHEMIHALLFVTQNNKDHDGHGPEFHKHMYRINKQAGTNISVYHNFHDEVNAYRQHWWKCSGPCQKWPPFYGVVKRAMNRAPAPRDTWWDDHKRKCGGEFTKIKEPENYGKRKAKGKSKDSSAPKEKEKKTGKDSKPNLPTFFDKLKKNQTGKSNTSVGKEGESKEINCSSSDSSDENLEHSPKKTKTEHSSDLSNFVAFSGNGNVLGGSKTGKTENQRDKHPLELLTTNSKGNVRQTSKTVNTGKPIGKQIGHVLEGLNISTRDKEKAKYVQEHKNEVVDLSSASGTSKRFNSHPSTSRADSSLNLDKGSGSNSKGTKKKTTSNLTILDAFARCKDPVNGIIEGTKNKPIDLSEETSNNVRCPACQTFIPITHINSHLDTCLTA